ncbi:gastrula zinc finger protein XlCGF46.1-like [Bicyclus anynana]|uniref:Gastrula zinc finger protein XlCGF46.1-like n=1 Tax=Bicyclus anynana TaxID=110368 RepID=A0ABM3LSK0_BICAN|nr:gastrula zinc finger protein XlCGF46.1-like [Bicyclus anynana]
MDQNICRLCSENLGVCSLFDITDCDDIRLCEKVRYCGKVTVVQGDGLPSQICMNCEEQLAATYNFLLRCEYADKRLRSLQVKDECDDKYDVKTEEFDNHDVKTEDFDNHDVISEEFDNQDVNAEDFDNHEGITEEFDNHDVNTEEFDNHKVNSEHFNNHAFENPCDSPPVDIKKEDNLLSPIRTKRKYVKKKSHKEKPGKCQVCGRICKSKSVLTSHMKSHSDYKPYACTSCDKRYKDCGTLKRHFDRNHNIARTKSVICEHCGKCFYSKGDCKIHMRIHTGETPYACTKCPARFTQVGSLQRHKLTHTGERSHACTICSKKFATTVQLKTHYLVHSDEKNHKCPYCEVAFKYKNSIRKHMTLHTCKTNENFICDYCGQDFLFKGNLQIHITKMHSTKSGYCDECSKYFPNIELHMCKHTGLRTIKCELCPSTFFDTKGLSTHVSFRHKSTDKYHCNIEDCTLKFPSQAMVQYHILRYHKSMKPFSCDKCPRSFYRKSDLVRHKRGTHKEFCVD